MHYFSCLAITLGVVATTLAPARADTVIGWAETAEAVLSNAPSAQVVQAKAIARLAMFNALNAIKPGYRAYMPAPEAVPDASAEAAIAMAAWTALASVPFVDRTALDGQLRSVLDKLPDGPAKIAGVALGRRAALLLLLERTKDDFSSLAPSPREPAPGIYELTPEHKRPSSIHWMRIRPFAIRSLQVCDPGPPPAWDSEAAIASARQSRVLGGRNSAVRTADQTAAALFWNVADDSDELAALKAITEKRQLAPLETARLLAIFAIAMIDSNICNALVKEKYRVWRPYNAIRGRFALQAVRDESWEALLTTPGNPDYPSGTASVAGIYERLLQAFNPANAVPPVWRSRAIKQARAWPTTVAMAEEMARSRIWGGIHSTFAMDAGLVVGRRIAEEVLAAQMVPLTK